MTFDLIGIERILILRKVIQIQISRLNVLFYLDKNLLNQHHPFPVEQLCQRQQCQNGKMGNHHHHRQQGPQRGIPKGQTFDAVRLGFIKANQ